MATSQEDECVICVNAKATMQTSPCGHRVVCRKCFVKTIQMAVSQRLLPLRCVICRAKILRLKQSSGHGGLTSSKSWLMPSSASSYSVSAKSWSAGSSRHHWTDKTWVPTSASQYSMTSRNVPNSASMYSMTSGSSSLSGMSSVSSATNSSTSSRNSSMPAGRGVPLRQPIGSLRKSQQYSMKMRIQEYNEPRLNEENEKPTRLAPIIEFQREYRLGKATSSSTRIRCAQKIVTQLEATPPEGEKNWKKSTPTTKSFFKSSLRSTGKEDKKKDDGKHKQEKGKEDKLDKSGTDIGTQEKDKKSDKMDKKKNKKETEKKDDGNGASNGKTDKKDTKSDLKKVGKKDVKTEKLGFKWKETKESKEMKKETAEKETLL
ncbi:hypothetical protein RUM44_009026 [Polyplax serrata]|uniref:RING-type domain-containing protein n=1 Tax=Polyplax serrata TaxID=468196 RepID=A0ABR1ARR8_POLSC